MSRPNPTCPDVLNYRPSARSRIVFVLCRAEEGEDRAAVAGRGGAAHLADQLPGHHLRSCRRRRARGAGAVHRRRGARCVPRALRPAAAAVSPSCTGLARPARLHPPWLHATPPTGTATPPHLT